MYNHAVLNEAALRSGLPCGKMGIELHYFERIDSTNQRAAELARQGAAEGTLLVADEQLQGRGRRGRRWHTPPGSALAFSLILRPAPAQALSPGGLGLVGALGVVEGLHRLGLSPQIKWPNDVLLGGRKVSGVLAEAAWVGESLDYVILGIGVNVREQALPQGAEMDFPATQVEGELGRRVDRPRLLLDILEGVDRWYPRLGKADLLAAWEDWLAFRGEPVELSDGSAPLRGILLGLTVDGWLRLADQVGEVVELEPGDHRLRPLAEGRGSGR
jgi:BirA family biotin operon repressor/biotin-[acetyl-CoA-carboxylase] ligase